MSNYNINAKPFNPRDVLRDEEEDQHHMMMPMHYNHNPWYPPPHPHPHPHYHHPYPPPFPVHHYPPQIPSNMQRPVSGPKSSKVEILEVKKETRDMEIQTDPIKEEVRVEDEAETEVKKRCNCRCIHTDSYPIPKGYTSEEATLWKKIRPSAKLTRVSNTLCVGEPDDLSFVRSNMLQYKFKLIKEKITDNTYYIKSVRTLETDPALMDFQIYYRDDNQMPYKTYLRLKSMTKIQEYDVERNCRLTTKITIPKGKKKIYKQTFDYVKKQKLLEVTDSETHEVLHTDILTGECWLENDFAYHG